MNKLVRLSNLLKVAWKCELELQNDISVTGQ